jgi:glutaminase
MFARRMPETTIIAAIVFTATIASVPVSAQSASPVAPRRQMVESVVREAYQRFKTDTSGKNADYIPYLA